MGTQRVLLAGALQGHGTCMQAVWHTSIWQQNSHAWLCAMWMCNVKWCTRVSTCNALFLVVQESDVMECDTMQGAMSVSFSHVPLVV